MWTSPLFVAKYGSLGGHPTVRKNTKPSHYVIAQHFNRLFGLGSVQTSFANWDHPGKFISIFDQPPQQQIGLTTGSEHNSKINMESAKYPGVEVSVVS